VTAVERVVGMVMSLAVGKSADERVVVRVKRSERFESSRQRWRG
jgi:hypothetical protein